MVVRGWFVLVALAPAGCFSHTKNFLPPPAPGSVPTELTKVNLPPYVIEAPDVLLVEVFIQPKEKLDKAIDLTPQAITGQHFVKPDGTIYLGIWGSVGVSGMTTEEAGEAVRRQVFRKMQEDRLIRDKGLTVDDPAKLIVIADVLAYNSKNYFVITDGAGYGEQVYQFPFSGNETVLNALANISGLPQVASKQHIWIARRTPKYDVEQILPVDYVGLTQFGVTATNYQLLPGDRLYVKSQRILEFDTTLQKVLTPIERLFGITLLGRLDGELAAEPELEQRVERAVTGPRASSPGGIAMRVLVAAALLAAAGTASDSAAAGVGILPAGPERLQPRQPAAQPVPEPAARRQLGGELLLRRPAGDGVRRLLGHLRPRRADQPVPADPVPASLADLAELRLAGGQGQRRHPADGAPGRVQQHARLPAGDRHAERPEPAAADAGGGPPRQHHDGPLT